MGYSTLKNRYYHPRFNSLGFKEYENNINQYRTERGLTISDLAKLIGIHSTYLWNIAEGYVGPYYESHKKNGFFKARPWAVKLTEIFKCDVLEIFPRESCFLIEKKELTNNQILEILHCEIKNTYEVVENNLVREKIFKLLKTLTAQEEMAVMYFYGFSNEYVEMTYRQIGDRIGVSTERIRQILARALRKLRHPYRSKNIVEFYD